MEKTELEAIPLTGELGVCGWSHLDPILLAALATEAPLLLIGPHGTAKSYLVVQIARALGLPMRHYNAALLNYDDLVGIPMPDETGEALHFITTPGNIWDAGFVFFDEISRCRADLQNKLYPIIHERHIVGIQLENLHHRWSAMNPPAPEEPETSATTEYYIGSESLDPALTDRFPYIVPVPTWADLSKADRLRLISNRANGSHPLPDLPALVAACADRIPHIEERFDTWIGDYIITLMDLLEQASLPQSPRRAAMLARSVAAVHAARLVLEGENADPEYSAEIAVLHGIPHSASEVPPSPVKLIALHKQAWEAAEHMDNEAWRQVMEEFDRARRVSLADQLDFTDEDLSRLITQTLSAEDSDARQMGLATAMFLAYGTQRDLDPSAFEPMAQLAYHVLEPRSITMSIDGNSPLGSAWTEIKGWIENQTGREDSFLFRLERNFLLAGFNNLWTRYNWQEALTQFKHDLILFGVEEAA